MLGKIVASNVAENVAGITVLPFFRTENPGKGVGEVAVPSSQSSLVEDRIFDNYQLEDVQGQYTVETRMPKPASMR